MNTVPYPKEGLALKLSGPWPYTIEHETRAICAIARQCTGDLLEIGCNYGFTTKALAESVELCTIYALDWSHNPKLNLWQAAEQPAIVAHWALRFPNVIAVNGDSARFNYPPGIGFVFIDANHTYEGIKADGDKAFEYRTKSARNVTILFHDYRPESQWQGVARYLDECEANGIKLGLVEDTCIVRTLE